MEENSEFFVFTIKVIGLLIPIVLAIYLLYKNRLTLKKYKKPIIWVLAIISVLAVGFVILIYNLLSEIYIPN